MRAIRIYVAVLVGVGAGCSITVAHAEGWNSTVHSGLNLADGNSEALHFNMGATVGLGEAGKDDNYTSLGVNLNYGENDSTTTVENYSASGKYRRVFTGNTYGYVDGSMLSDDIANLDFRVVLGPGVGRYFIRNATTWLSGDIGVSWLYEDQGGLDDSAVVLRFGEQLVHELSENSRIFGSVEYLPEFEDFGNFLLSLEAGIEADINDKFSLRVVVKDRYDRTPAPGKEENDFELIAGLKYIL